MIKELIDENIILDIGNCLYNKSLYDKEHYICNKLIEYNNNESIINHFQLTINKIDNKIKKQQCNNQKEDLLGFQKLITTFNKEQEEAIKNIFINANMIINGKAGTGKTTTIKYFIKFINDFGLLKKCNIFFMAPTAAAKEKIKDTMISKDILKGIKFDDNNFMTIHSFNRKKLNECYSDIDKYHILIIDETSMLDIDTLYNFILQLKYINLFSIFFLGDTRQLPSVGLGDVLNRLIKSNTIKSTELIQVNRSKPEIITLLDTVIDGKYINNCIDNKFLCWNKNSNIIQIIEEYKESIKQNETLIITPLKNTITRYTNMIRNIININIKNNNDEIKYSNIYCVDDKYDYNGYKSDIIKSIEINQIEYNNNIYRVGDKVMHIKNFNKEKLYNGLVGYVSKIIEIMIKNKNKIIHIIIVNYDKLNIKSFNYVSHEEYLKYLIPAYMITIHKSQGQEYNNIILIIDGDSRLLNRNLLYTALSRAKNKIIIISNTKYINTAIDTTIKIDTLMDKMLKYYNDSSNELDFIDYIKL